MTSLLHGPSHLQQASGGELDRDQMQFPHNIPHTKTDIKQLQNIFVKWVRFSSRKQHIRRETRRGALRSRLSQYPFENILESLYTCPQKKFCILHSIFTYKFSFDEKKKESELRIIEEV